MRCFLTAKQLQLSALLLPLILQLQWASALPVWADGRWYDAPKDFNLPVTICKRPAEVLDASTVIGCKVGWVHYLDSCYRLIDRSSEFAQAILRCWEHSRSTLVSIASQEENAFVRSLCGPRICWLGLQEKRDMEIWRWLDGTPTSDLSYQNWQDGEPNNYHGRDENVAMMHYHLSSSAAKGGRFSGTWYDVPSQFDKPIGMCEVQGPDCGEGEEFYNQKCYRLLDWPSTWHDAETRCEQFGGLLASVGSIGEQVFLHELCGKRMCWLGLLEGRGTEQWVWIDGAPASYQNWEPGEPNNAGGRVDENRAVMNFRLHEAKEDGEAWSHKQGFTPPPPVKLRGSQLNKPLPAWAKGMWYDCPRDFNVPISICERNEGDEAVCSQDWVGFNGKCYLVIDRGSEYGTAVRRCWDHGEAALVKITSAEENAFVRQLCGARMCWLGLREEPGTETWTWPGGPPTTVESYMNWSPGEPNNFNHRDEDVAVMNFYVPEVIREEAAKPWNNGNWYDIPGIFNKPKALCEIEQRPSAVPAGIPQWRCFRNSCYRLMDFHSNYNEAERRCAEVGSHLVSIGSEDEQFFVKDLCGKNMCWLGYREHPHTEQWYWIDGTPEAYDHWETGEPNDGGSTDENRAVMNLNVRWVEEDSEAWTGGFSPDDSMKRESVLGRTTLGSSRGYGPQVASCVLAFVALMIVVLRWGPGFSMDNNIGEEPLAMREATEALEENELEAYEAREPQFTDEARRGFKDADAQE